MSSHLHFVLITLCLLQKYVTTDQVFRHGNSKVVYFNPKYVFNVTIYTGRKSRLAPYLTTYFAGNLVPFGNNVTFRSSLKNYEKTELEFDMKLCDGFKSKWMRVWLKKYSDMPFNRCPMTPGFYHFKDMLLPPKNLPVMISQGDYSLRVLVFVTDTKEKVIEIHVRLYIERKKHVT